MDIKKYKYPSFWRIIKRGFNRDNINEELICPMNYLYNMDLTEFHSQDTTLPMKYFFQKYEMDNNIRTCRKVEDLIEKYSIKLYECNSNTYGDETYLLLRKDFDDLISEMQKIKISKNYLGLFSWLIDRGFIITHNIKSTQFQLKSTINKNRAILLRGIISLCERYMNISCHIVHLILPWLPSIGYPYQGQGSPQSGAVLPCG